MSGTNNIGGPGKTPQTPPSIEIASKDVQAKELPPAASKPGAEFVANNEVKEAGKISLAESLGIDPKGAAVVAFAADLLGAFRGSKPGANDPTVAALTKRTLDA